MGEVRFAVIGVDGVFACFAKSWIWAEVAFCGVWVKWEIGEIGVLGSQCEIGFGSWIFVCRWC